MIEQLPVPQDELGELYLLACQVAVRGRRAEGGGRGQLRGREGVERAKLSELNCFCSDSTDGYTHFKAEKG